MDVNGRDSSAPGAHTRWHNPMWSGSVPPTSSQVLCVCCCGGAGVKGGLAAAVVCGPHPDGRGTRSACPGGGLR